MLQIKFPCAQWLYIQASSIEKRKDVLMKKNVSPFGKGVLTLLKVFQVWDLLVVITTTCFVFCFFPFKCSNLEIVIKADLPDPLMAASVAAVFAYTFKNTFQRFNSIRADDFLLMVQSIMSIVCSKSFPICRSVVSVIFQTKKRQPLASYSLLNVRIWQLFFICHLCILQLVVGQRE